MWTVSVKKERAEALRVAERDGIPVPSPGADYCRSISYEKKEVEADENVHA